VSLTRDALKSVMERDPAIAQQIAESLLSRLQAFGRDLRKIDDFLSHVETAAPKPWTGRMDEAEADSLSHFTPLPPSLQQKTGKFR
jgi:hypothetical protein